MVAAIVVLVGLLPGPVAARPEEGEIVRLYEAVLGREPEPGGFDYWVIRRQTGTGLSGVAAYFLDSPEYRRRFVPAGAEADDDAAFVTRVYQLVLGRTPDRAGFLYWLGRLDSGLSRAALVLNFSESPEFIRRTGTGSPDVPAFRAAVAAVTASDLGPSWHPGCPVGPGSLRAVTMMHVRPDGRAATGRLIVNADVVDSVIVGFARLYAARFPIERMEPVSIHGGDDEASMAANNTSAFNCRPVSGGTSWSRHALGRAIDINPAINPFVTGGVGSPDAVVLPDGSERFLDRTSYHPMMIRDRDVVVATFERLGWRWGGRWRDPWDPQHVDHG